VTTRRLRTLEIRAGHSFLTGRDTRERASIERAPSPPAALPRRGEGRRSSDGTGLEHWDGTRDGIALTARPLASEADGRGGKSGTGHEPTVGQTSGTKRVPNHISSLQKTYDES
jgi:hypothetical protein